MIDDAVRNILEISRSRNRELEVTGCLIFAEGRFAQALEGSQVAIERLMRSIGKDGRHRDVEILEQGCKARRRFTRWSMGYAGPSYFVSKTILDATPIEAGAVRRDGSHLLRLMRAFGAP